MALLEITVKSFANADICHRYHTQHGYRRTNNWFELSNAPDLFGKYLAGLIESAADRPVHVLEVRNMQNRELFACLVHACVLCTYRGLLLFCIEHPLVADKKIKNWTLRHEGSQTTMNPTYS